MASLSSPIGPTIDVVARTVSRSVISGGNNVDIQPQASLVNVERNLEIQTTEIINKLKRFLLLKVR